MTAGFSGGAEPSWPPAPSPNGHHVPPAGPVGAADHPTIAPESSAPRPGPAGTPASGPDVAAERALRAEVREAVGRLLDERQLLAPQPDQAQRIRALVREHLLAYQRRAATAGAPVIADPAGVEQRLVDSVLGLGPLEPLLRDEEVEEVIVNGPQRVFAIDRTGKHFVPHLVFDGDEELRSLVKRIVGPLGRRLDESSPMVDVRLPDGSRLNAVIPPATTRWTCVTIRKFILRAHSLEELVGLGTLPEPAAQFLDAAVQAGVNVLVSGGTGAGKTTVLNCLGASVPSEDRVVTIEEVPELTLERQLPDCVALQSRAGNVEGAGEITIRQLVRNALRMRPTRLVVGEVRGEEALEMLLAMNTGHDGSMSTVHANGPRQALDRLVTLASMAEERIPVPALRHMVATTLELVVHLQLRHHPRRRRVSHIWEVTGQEGDVLTGHDLWVLDPARDRLVWTGIRPRCLTRMADRGVAYAPPPAPERS
jgi:pilus assembly protein CpaF